ncbi:MAG: LptF/LptG family permease [Myxococcota bacterium]
MTILDRYLLREIMQPFFVGLGLFFVVIAVEQVLRVSDSVTGFGISGGQILGAVAYSLPPVLGLLIPISLLFATLLAFGRLAGDQEILAMAAQGVGLLRLLRVPMFAGTVLGILCAVILVLGEPWGFGGLKSLMARGAQQALAKGVRPGEFNQWIPGVTFYAQERHGNILQGVLLADRRNASQPIIVSAKQGHMQIGEDSHEIVFDLQDGKMMLYERHANTHRVIDFQSSQYRLDVGRLVQRKIRAVDSAQSLTVSELRQRADDEEISTSQRARYVTTLHRKFALPLATLIFALLAVPLSLHQRAGARAWGFLFSAAIVCAYYYLGRGFELAARSDGFSAALAPWMPDIVATIALSVLLYRSRGKL